MKQLWRYVRQVQVIGEDAQRALLADRAMVLGGPDDLGALFEALYLAGAGVGTVAAEHHDVAAAAKDSNPTVATPVAPARPEEVARHGRPDVLLGFTDETALAAARGALAALSHIRRTKA